MKRETEGHNHHHAGLRLLAGCAGTMLLAGCTVGPDYHSPQVSMPAGWVSPTSAPSTQSAATTRPAGLERWWTAFGDKTLQSLVERAIDGNLDIRLAQSRIRQARAQRAIVAGGQWPMLDASGAYRRSHTGGAGGQDLYQAGLDASWELDVFGGVRRSVEAADANVQASQEDLRDVSVTLVAEVAVNYLELRGQQSQLAIARENLAAQESSARLTRKQFQGGLTGSLDVVNAEAQVASTRSLIPSLEAGAQQSIYRLGVLLGQQPETLVAELTAPGPIPATAVEVPAGLPSDLLRRRADIRRAEAQLHSANAGIGVATAELFPKFSLTGNIGTAGAKPSSLVNWNNRSWSIGPSVSWAVFDAGKIKAGIEVNNALQEQALITYQQTVLTSLEDVESSLVAYVRERQHRESLAEAVVANRKAVELSTQLYTMGQTDFLNVLSAQRSLLASQGALSQSDVTLATDLVAVYKALGGGWESITPATMPTAP